MPKKPLKDCVAGDDLEMGRVEYHLQDGVLVKLTAGVKPDVVHNPAELDRMIAQKQAELTDAQTLKAEYLKLATAEPEPVPE